MAQISSASALHTVEGHQILSVGKFKFSKASSGFGFLCPSLVMHRWDSAWWRGLDLREVETTCVSKSTERGGPRDVRQGTPITATFIPSGRKGLPKGQALKTLLGFYSLLTYTVFKLEI